MERSRDLTLPTGPLPHLAMDYARLRAEGLRLLGRLAGARWTDFNTHDPGVTILEQLCYGITDLGYRINYPVADLVAGLDSAGLPGPAELLTCDPVTRQDLRALVLDIPGVENARVEDPDAPALAFYHHPGSNELRLHADPGEPGDRPVRLRGLHQVLLQISDRITSEPPLDAAAARLHGSRLCGEEFVLAPQKSFPVWLHATIEVGFIEDPIALLADIIERIETYLAPPARFISLAEARARGRRIDALLEGPLLSHGFVDELPAPRRAVYTSDLIHAIMDVPQVRAVRSIEMAISRDAKRERWALNVPPGHVPILSGDANLSLLRAGLPVPVDMGRARELRNQRRRTRAEAAIDLSALRVPRGRDRALARYRSIQRQLPAAYGVGTLGLPASAPAPRRARARQLQAYLLIFDQLLANAFAQLAHAGELLSPGGDPAQSYFAQPVDDPPLDLPALLADPQAHALAPEPGNPLERRKRFLAHLLARFAEQLGEQGPTGSAEQTGDARAGDRDAVFAVDEAEATLIRRDRAIIEARQEFLRNYPRLSGARGSGEDLFGDTASGLAERLRLKLGARDDVHFHLVEHVLLRPVPEDSGQLAEEGEEEVPLLAGVDGPDPWSLQVSFVFKELDKPDPAFEDRVGQMILAETPAHLVPRLCWLGAGEWDAFATAWREFRDAYRAYRRAGLQTATDEIQLRARDRRDQVIDLLGFAATYPLRDVPLLSEHLVVASGDRATITLLFSQPGVTYELWSHDAGAQLTEKVGGRPIAAAGTGGELVLTTPPILEDIDVRIRAVKGARKAWLRCTVHIEEGIDPRVSARLRLPLLDTSIDNPGPGDARIAGYGAHIEVEIQDSQEGVAYTLINDADHAVVLPDPVIGTSGAIVLTLGPVTEDMDLRVHGTREVGDPENPEVRTAVLDVILPLRVRANPAVGAALDPVIVSHGGTSRLKLTGAQANAGYRVWQRPIRDREIVFDEPPAVETIDVVSGDRVIRVQRPERPEMWKDVPGFVLLGELAPDPDGALVLDLGARDRDTLFLVQAVKQHQSGPLKTTDAILSSAVQLDRALALLVRPDHGRDVRVLALIDGDADAGTGPLQVMGGQPGVFYEFRLEAAPDPADPIDRPAYFHQRDDVSDAVNKGIDQLRVGVDLVLARDSGAEPGDLSQTPPPWPLFDAELAPGTVLRVCARKAMTGLEVDLDHTVTVDKGGQ